MNPYDMSVLAQLLKEAGLDGTEVGAVKAYQAMKKWFVMSAQASKSPLDDMAIPFINQLDPIVMPQIDKINGRVG